MFWHQKSIYLVKFFAPFKILVFQIFCIFKTFFGTFKQEYRKLNVLWIFIKASLDPTSCRMICYLKVNLLPKLLNKYTPFHMRFVFSCILCTWLFPWMQKFNLEIKRDNKLWLALLVNYNIALFPVIIAKSNFLHLSWLLCASHRT